MNDYIQTKIGLIPSRDQRISLDSHNNNVQNCKQISTRCVKKDSISHSESELFPEDSYVSFQEALATNNIGMDKKCEDESKSLLTYKQFKPKNDLEQNERLVIKLVKLDFSGKLNGFNGDKWQTNVINAGIAGIKQKVCNTFRKPTKKVTKSELQHRNLVNINKTESLRMEELLLKKFKKKQERKSTKDVIEIIDVFKYEKTSPRSILETYKQLEDKNGQVSLHCLLCTFIGKRFQQMTLHYKSKHKGIPIEELHFCNATLCTFKTLHKGMLKMHKKKHITATDKLELETHPCHLCAKIFKQRKGLLIHLKLLHKDPPGSTSAEADFPCATCNYRTTTEKNLQAHIYSNHAPAAVKRKFTCNICGYETCYRECLKKHLTRVHLRND